VFFKDWCDTVSSLVASMAFIAAFYRGPYRTQGGVDDKENSTSAEDRRSIRCDSEKQ
jgi:hypothetical protein